MENEEEEFQGSTGNNDLDVVINISNGYPSYTCTAYMVIVNRGTVPVSLIQWFILPVQPSGGVNQTSALPLDIGLAGIWVGYTLDPGASANVSLKIHVNQSSSESSTYIFQVKFRFPLWTQVTTPPPGQQSISISKYFTDTDGNSLTFDVDGFYNVSIVINKQGKAVSGVS